ncbi:MAG: hypothetical protein ACRDL3_10805 [Solirubrobacterales bacterium]
MTEELVVARRYQGFPEIALGGYVGGLLAGMLDGPTEVSYRAAVPMDRPLHIERPEPDRVVLSDGTPASARCQGRRDS